ncbi:sucrose-specific PTS transporter subunit IIBC [Aerococcaceae bacterium zg-BR33]|nr:sucrose-specific PTS transporter subunit IIBC [Aerococcaceae bacterium zg-A91]MBS4457386.1 sucrose-specific PTS transporter subunit IIBC [Aerococcaceae bacterium zg-BR33]
MDFITIAQSVVTHLGGVENINSIAHCATRLRVMVRDEEKINKEAIENTDKVMGAFFNSGQYQIIFGTGTVNKVYEAVAQIPGIHAVTKSEQKEAVAAKPQGNTFQRLVRTFGDVFVPIIPVLVATGLFMGLRGLVTRPEVLGLFGMTKEMISPNFLQWTEILTDTAFAFLPALVAWSSFKVFGGNPVLGIVLGLMMVHPSLPNAYDVAANRAQALTFFGFIPVVGYQGTVIPAFIVGFVGVKLEKWLHKKVPDTFDLLVTPFLTLFVMSILGLFAIGPVFHSLETIVLAATEWILGLPFGLAGLIIGGLQQIIVVTGIHHIFNFLEVQLISNSEQATGVAANPFNAFLTAATAAQAGAIFAVGRKTTNPKLKALSFSAGISCLLGITEPAIFGVNLRYGKPFIMGLIGGAVGGFVAGLFNLAATGMSITVLPGTLLYLNQLLPYLLMMTIAFAVAFALTYTIGFNEEMTVNN